MNSIISVLSESSSIYLMINSFIFSISSLLVIPSVIFSIAAQWYVSSTFNKYSKIKTRRLITGETAARLVCRTNEVSNIIIEPVSGRLNDHFDPKANKIRLSDGVYSQVSVAAVGVAAHEAGHAAQYAAGYGPIRLRRMIIPITQIGSHASMPLVILGIFMGFPALIDLGIAAFCSVFLFQLITLPVEFNASKRAISALEDGHILDSEELRQAKKVLSAAALTYVASLAVSLAQIVRLLAIRGRRR